MVKALSRGSKPRLRVAGSRRSTPQPTTDPSGSSPWFSTRMLLVLGRLRSSERTRSLPIPRTVADRRRQMASSSRQIARLRWVLQSWGPSAGRRYPWRVCDDAYQRLLAEVLLQRPRADPVAAVWNDVVVAYPSPSHLASASEGEIARVIRPLGLVNKRTAYLKKLGAALVEAGRIPEDAEELSRMAGIGRYSAAAFLVSWKGARAKPVDANVRRVLGRVAIGESVNESDAEALVQQLLSRGDPATLLFGLLDLGARPCRPRNPICAQCPARLFCRFATRDASTDDGVDRPRAGGGAVPEFEPDTPPPLEIEHRAGFIRGGHLE